jgi:hypothetical protein
MKLLKTKTGELTRTIKGGDLLDVKLNYKVASAWGELDYKGPKIPHEVWHQIVSFLKWSNDTTGSEAQVRLFVSPKSGTWKAWAFPQEGGTGLSSKEIDDDESKSQRAALFEKDDEWVAWGTVHSHANIGAFQSGTDEHDEEGQGGLHITVGNLSDNHYSFHARLYHQKDMFEPDMSLFWDIGDPFNGLAPEILALLPKTPANELARVQMCVPVMVDFPQQWKVNYRMREKEPPKVNSLVKHNGKLMTDEELDKWFAQQRETKQESGNFTGDVTARSPYYMRVKAAVEEVIDLEIMYNIEDGGLIELLTNLSEQVPTEIVAICCQFNLSPSDILAGIRKLEREMKESEKNGHETEQPGLD